MPDKSPSGRGDVPDPPMREEDFDGDLKHKPKPRSTIRKLKKKKIAEPRQEQEMR